MAAYAVAGDFCRLFAEDMNGLYVLSLLLTADPAKAEECFVCGLEDCIGANRVFQQWTRSWARRTIIQNAIRVMKPTPEYTGPWASVAPLDDRREPYEGGIPLAAILELKTFERFVFVMSVLERYSDQDCRALVGGSRQDIVRARTRAVRSLSAFREGPAPNVTSRAGQLLILQRLMGETA